MTSDELRARLQELARRGVARCADPEYQRQAAKLAASCDRIEQADARHRLLAAGVPRAFVELVEAPEETPALSAARAFLARRWSDPARQGAPPLVLLLAGSVGRGKSVAAAWAVREYGAGRARFTEASALVAVSAYDREALLHLQRIGLLALDELGMEPLDEAGWGEAKFCDLLNGRIQSGRPTVLVTNLDPARFVARYPDQRLRDRLRAHADVFTATGPSMRGSRP